MDLKLKLINAVIDRDTFQFFFILRQNLVTIPWKQENNCGPNHHPPHTILYSLDILHSFILSQE